MRTLPTVILRHETAGETHHDWLLADPAAAGRGGAGYVVTGAGPGGVAGAVVEGDADLWAARCAAPPPAWRALGVWWLEPIAPHRRRYLWYQGPLSGGRGTVRRVDRGTVTPLQWTMGRAVLDVRLTGFAGRVALTALAPRRWRAEVVR